jgi:endonuclease YncB( thermonuclease family)
MRNLPLAAVLVALAALPATAWSQARNTRDCGELPKPFDGLVFAGDGDTVYGVGFKPGIRLWGMNAPELRDGQKAETVPGMEARALTATLLQEAGNKARCEPTKWDVYCRVVALCTTAQGKDLGLELLKAGMAYSYYLSTDPERTALALTYTQAEADAIKAEKGLWPYWLGHKPLVEQKR